jgi:ABC-type uncharacterized transport system ATPase component
VVAVLVMPIATEAAVWAKVVQDFMAAATDADTITINLCLLAHRALAHRALTPTTEPLEPQDGLAWYKFTHTLNKSWQYH